MHIDSDRFARLTLLAELMEKHPRRRMKKLQREALKHYPLESLEAVRHWMGFRTAFAAADILNKPLIEESYSETP